MATTELLKIEGFSTKEIALTQKPINEVLKESEGVIINYTKSSVKANLTKLVKKHTKEIDELIAKETLTVKEESRLIELRKPFKDSRIALDKITKHNASVLAQASKKGKSVQAELTEIVQHLETKISDRLESEEQRREKQRQDRIDAENKRKEKLQAIVDTAAADLSKIIGSTKEFSQIEENEKQFNSALAIFDNALEDKTIDLQEFDVVYRQMVDEKSEEFDNVIKALENAHNLELANKALEVQKLNSERMELLFDLNFKYKGETPLGELTRDEFKEIYLKVRSDFRIAILEDELEMLGSEVFKSWIYAGADDIILVSISEEEIKTLSDADFNAKVEYFKKEIKDWNEAEPIEEIEVKEEENLSESNQNIIEENATEEEKIELETIDSEFEKEEKQELENNVDLEPTIKDVILSTVSNLVADFVCYGRKECPFLSSEQLEEAINNQVVTIDEIVAKFRAKLQEVYPNK